MAKPEAQIGTAAVADPKAREFLRKADPVMAPTKLPMQPADEGDFAAYVVGCVADGPGGDRQPFGGPDIMSFGEVAEQYQAARGLRRRILPLPLPRAAARAAGDLTCPEGRRGTTTWAEWLTRHPPRSE